MFVRSLFGPLMLASSLPIMFSTDQNSGGGDENDDDDDDDSNDDASTSQRKSDKPEGLTPEIEKWLGKKIANAERKAKVAGAKAKEAEIASQREQEDAEKKGEYETAKKKLTEDLATATARVTELETTVETLTKHFDEQYKADLAALPEAFRVLAPDDDEPYEKRSKWLTDAKKQADKLGTKPRRGNGQDDPPKNDERIVVDDEVKKNRQRSAYRSF